MSDPYRLWLTRTYSITRNDVLDRFVVGETTFATLDEAINSAHELELEKAAKFAEQNERRRLAREERLEADRIEAERAAEEWSRNKPKVLTAAALGTIAVALFIYSQIESPEEKSARIAKERAEKIEFAKSVEKRFGLKLPEDAKKIQINENASNFDFLCNDQKNGILLTFITNLTNKQVRDAISKNL